MIFHVVFKKLGVLLLLACFDIVHCEYDSFRWHLPASALDSLSALNNPSTTVFPSESPLINANDTVGEDSSSSISDSVTGGHEVGSFVSSNETAKDNSTNEYASSETATEPIADEVVSSHNVNNTSTSSVAVSERTTDATPVVSAGRSAFEVIEPLHDHFSVGDSNSLTDDPYATLIPVSSAEEAEYTTSSNPSADGSPADRVFSTGVEMVSEGTQSPFIGDVGVSSNDILEEVVPVATSEQMFEKMESHGDSMSTPNGCIDEETSIVSIPDMFPYDDISEATISTSTVDNPVVNDEPSIFGTTGLPNDDFGVTTNGSLIDVITESSMPVSITEQPELESGQFSSSDLNYTSNDSIVEGTSTGNMEGTKLLYDEDSDISMKPVATNDRSILKTTELLYDYFNATTKDARNNETYATSSTTEVSSSGISAEEGIYNLPVDHSSHQSMLNATELLYDYFNVTKDGVRGIGSHGASSTDKSSFETSTEGVIDGLSANHSSYNLQQSILNATELLYDYFNSTTNGVNVDGVDAPSSTTKLLSSGTSTKKRIDEWSYDPERSTLNATELLYDYFNATTNEVKVSESFASSTTANPSDIEVPSSRVINDSPIMKLNYDPLNQDSLIFEPTMDLNPLETIPHVDEYIVTDVISDPINDLQLVSLPNPIIMKFIKNASVDNLDIERSSTSIFIPSTQPPFLETNESSSSAVDVTEEGSSLSDDIDSSTPSTSTQQPLFGKVPENVYTEYTLPSVSIPTTTPPLREIEKTSDYNPWERDANHVSPSNASDELSYGVINTDDYDFFTDMNNISNDSSILEFTSTTQEPTPAIGQYGSSSASTSFSSSNGDSSTSTFTSLPTIQQPSVQYDTSSISMPSPTSPQPLVSVSPYGDVISTEETYFDYSLLRTTETPQSENRVGEEESPKKFDSEISIVAPSSESLPFEVTKPYYSTESSTDRESIAPPQSLEDVLWLSSSNASESEMSGVFAPTTEPLPFEDTKTRYSTESDTDSETIISSVGTSLPLDVLRSSSNVSDSEISAVFAPTTEPLPFEDTKTQYSSEGDTDNETPSLSTATPPSLDNQTATSSAETTPSLDILPPSYNTTTLQPWVDSFSQFSTSFLEQLVDFFVISLENSLRDVLNDVFPPWLQKLESVLVSLQDETILIMKTTIINETVSMLSEDTQGRPRRSDTTSANSITLRQTMVFFLEAINEIFQNSNDPELVQLIPKALNSIKTLMENSTDDLLIDIKETTSDQLSKSHVMSKFTSDMTELLENKLGNGRNSEDILDNLMNDSHVNDLMVNYKSKFLKEMDDSLLNTLIAVDDKRGLFHDLLSNIFAVLEDLQNTIYDIKINQLKNSEMFKYPENFTASSMREVQKYMNASWNPDHSENHIRAFFNQSIVLVHRMIEDLDYSADIYNQSVASAYDQMESSLYSLLYDLQKNMPLSLDSRLFDDSKSFDMSKLREAFKRVIEDHLRDVTPRVESNIDDLINGLPNGSVSCSKFVYPVEYLLILVCLCWF